MKTNKLIGVFVFIFLAANSWCQVPFPTFLYQMGIDFNHYSIEQSPMDDTYVIAGTLFNPSGDTEIHLIKVDLNGILMWEVTANPGWDDRGLDVMVDPNTAEIVVVGYTDAAGPSPDIYMGKWDAGGGFVNDFVININNAGSTFPCAATNIIYSPSTGQYIVGGFWAENFNYPLVPHNYAILFSVDPGLSTVNWVNHFTSNMLEAHSSVNDILETSTGRVFATGSAGLTTGGVQGVLAVMVDPNTGAMTQNLSFESTNSEHVGVSAIYDDASDEIWLMSNNSVVHNPQINLIRNVSGSPFLEPSVSYYLEVDNTYGSYNAAGFTLLPHFDHPHDVLVAVGYHRTKGPSGNDATLWYTEFERYSGAPFAPALEWMAPSNAFHTHGGGLFSTFSGEHPYIFNQEIMVDNLYPSPNTSRYVALAPSDHSGNYGIDIAPLPGYGSCVKDFNVDPFAINWNDFIVLDFLGSPNYVVNLGVSNNTQSYQKEWCYLKPRSASEEENALESAEESLNLVVSPNPAVDRITVLLEGEQTTGTLTIQDISGLTLKSFDVESNLQKEIRLDDLASGLYFIQYQDQERSIYRKVIKL